MRQRYVICSDQARGFWSNAQGWVFDVASATKFTARETARHNLPSCGLGADCRIIMEQNARDYTSEI